MAGLIQVQPYDPDKIPLLLVHGLQSTPAVWAKMVNALWADPVIRRNYQIWVFGYPDRISGPVFCLVTPPAIGCAWQDISQSPPDRSGRS